VAICFESNVLFDLTEADNRDWTPRYSFSDIIGISAALGEAKKKARRVAATDATVLITGESGTGKELFAHAIHTESKRQNRPFVRLNCSSIPSELLEAELFGYEAGAFTGARKSGRPGMFEIANTGTIFLDEISQMNWDIQAKFLRILQEKEIVRVGGTRPILVDFRLILATNASLEELVRAGRFRSDLYYRINVYPINIPPLRERKVDIPVLIQHFTERLQRDPNQQPRTLSKEVINAFESFNWPGNVRELLHVLEQLFISSMSGVIGLKDLPLYITQRELNEKPSTEVLFEGDLKQIMEDTEKKVLSKTLKEVQGNKRKAAELLGIHRSGLYQKLRKHGL
jgi:transcriptional regulator with PAS, ATPase and Fis domain